MPQHIKIYGDGRQLLCHYRVVEATTFGEWTVPTQFELDEYYSLEDGRSIPRIQVVGTVTSINVSQGSSVIEVIEIYTPPFTTPTDTSAPRTA